MKLSIGFSPCPNDTFIFDALVHHKIDTEGINFSVHLADVEELNNMAFRQELDVTKISYHAFLYVVEDYILLNSGSALGKGVGPLLICRSDIAEDEIANLKVAIPGRYTTANLLLNLAYPQTTHKIEVLFSEIEDMVLKKKFDAGLIIHENRFTYQEKGLQKIKDLGEFWEETSGELIPLGGIVCKRDIDSELQQKIDRIVRKSIEYAFEHPNSSKEYVYKHAQEMKADVIQKHIGLYVNQYSIDLGKKGKRAVDILFKLAKKSGIIKSNDQKIYLE